MKKSSLLLLVLLPLFFFDCSSGKKAFEQGNYYEAVVKAVNRLRQNPTHKKSKETLRTGYPLAVETLEMDAQNAMASNAPFKYREVIRHYQTLNNLYNEIRRAPGALKVIPNPKNYSSQIAELKPKAAEECYAAGVEALARNTRQDAKQAYFLFRDTQEFVPGYKDVINQMNEAKFEATLKVVVEQIPVPAMYSLSSRFFQDKIEEYLHDTYRTNEFVRFYTPREAEVEQLAYTDQYLRLQFDDFVVGETHTLKETTEVSKDSVIVGTVTLDDGKKVNAYNTVKAKMTVWKKEVVSKGLFSMQVYDAHTDAVLTHRKFDGEFVWISQWGSFNGDERALNAEHLKICKGSEVPPPPPQELFIEFTRPIYNQLVSALNGFYGQY